MVGGVVGVCDLPELIGDGRRGRRGERRSYGEGQSRLDVMERLLIAVI
jgi:hypothetical protein